MAKKPSLKRGKKADLTVRERSQQQAVTKKRVLRRTAGAASRPFRALGRGLAKVFRPLRFILRPFKTRPVRFVGRILAKVLLLGYFRNAWRELRQVSWPDRRETRQLTVAVFAFAFVFGLMILVVDYGLDKVFKKVFLK